MLKLLLKSEEEWDKFVRNDFNDTPYLNKPERYPCLIVDVVYKYKHDMPHGRYVDILYLEDVRGLLLPQLEDKNERSS